MNEAFTAQLWLIPALPLAAAAIGALTPRSGRAVAAGAAIAGILRLPGGFDRLARHRPAGSGRAPPFELCLV